VEILSAQTRHQRDPWRATHEQLVRQCHAWRDTSPDELKAAFLDMAKLSMLSSDDVLAGSYLLYGTTADYRIFAGMLQVGTTQRVRTHNAYVASGMSSAWLAQHGATVCALTWPLFPAAVGFSALNLKLLSECASVQGGGATSTVPSVYRQPAAPALVQGGAPFAPVVPDSTGNLFADMHDVADAFTAINRRLTDMERFRGRGRRQQRGRGGQPQQQQQQQQWAGPRGGEVTEHPAKADF
jgi:hypothetical protein